MPELPEVNKAVNLINRIGVGKVIQKVETVEDTIVFAGTTHDDFVRFKSLPPLFNQPIYRKAKELTGRTLESAGRYGKVFYLNLSGSGKMPVLHFGMTGMLQVHLKPPIFSKNQP